jgi:glutamine---fructose-6-phosphate transaminase (isomerizing)
MNLNDPRYARFALVREMLDTVAVAKGYDPDQTAEVAKEIKAAGRLMLTGEGSSRIFPAKNAIRKAQTWGLDLAIATEGSRQAAQYDLSRSAVFLASNSGRTKEVVLLAKKLAAEGNRLRFGLTANEGTLLAQEVTKTWVLRCGWEQACAATKSVVEQALFYQSLISHVAGDCPNFRPSENGTVPLARPPRPNMRDSLVGLDQKIAQVLAMPIDRQILDRACDASTIYFAGYNDGVAEELTLKTNEITRKKSDYLEGSYAVHGIEEVMDPKDIVFVVDPIEGEIEKFQEVLEKGVGLTVIAIADRPTPFPTIRVPSAGELTPCLYLCAGWNLLVEIGLRMNIDLDKPQRARKVGNEYIAG